MEHITIKDIEPLVPFSRGSTEIFHTGLWSGKKPAWRERTSPCRQACPIGNDIARAFSLAARGAFDEALTLFRQNNPLPGVCGRVCYHPCEGDCNRKDLDEAVNIRAFERYLADHGKVRPEPPVEKKKERVAVVGSGPAGLSAAYHLARLGYPVTIFEAFPEPGGMLRYGIPEYRLPKNILKAEIASIVEQGVAIKTGVRIGKDFSVSALKEEYQAVFLALGAHSGMRLGMEGEDGPGVIEGIAFLHNINGKSKPDLGRRVAVIGGGNTAIDCARSAHRMGADVRVIYRRSRSEMPALAEDVDAIEAEGIALDLLAAPQRVIREQGRVSALECVRMELGEPDESGRRRPVPVKGSEYLVSVDTVIAAVGQTPESDFLKEIGLSLTSRGIIETSPSTATNVLGVFAGGDGAGARAFVADAIASGKKAALAISCYLEGKDEAYEYERRRIGGGASFSFAPSDQIDLKDVVTSDKLNTICIPYAPRNNNPSARSRKKFAEVAGGLDPGRMEKEIARCFKCGTCTQCDFCYLVCPDISIVKAHEGYTVKLDYCKGCGVCAEACPRHAIEMGGGI